MRGEPLHVCTAGHPVIMYAGIQCPYCKLQTEFTLLRLEVQHLKRQTQGVPLAEQEQPEP